MGLGTEEPLNSLLFPWKGEMLTLVILNHLLQVLAWGFLEFANSFWFLDAKLLNRVLLDFRYLLGFAGTMCGGPDMAEGRHTENSLVASLIIIFRIVCLHIGC